MSVVNNPETRLMLEELILEYRSLDSRLHCNHNLLIILTEANSMRVVNNSVTRLMLEELILA